ncbi:P-loop containing nucleoside triphosphate hydrolase protein [Lactarius deliciosus]|nr:P-loop containing nucleoside triphosphate hydrolase protein [Lactarius deliciosus]
MKRGRARGGGMPHEVKAKSRTFPRVRQIIDFVVALTFRPPGYSRAIADDPVYGLAVVPVMRRTRMVMLTSIKRTTPQMTRWRTPCQKCRLTLLSKEDAEGDIEVNGEGDDEVLPSDGKPYALRQRAKVNYAIPPPLDEIPFAPPKPTSGRSGGGRSNWNRAGAKKGPGWSANGAELSRFLGLPGDDSDSDAPRAPRKGFGNPAFTGGVGSILPGDLAAAAGTPANFGKVGDADINSLKEMTLLPLLYPEVFQRFGLTPPRGVLFHGPPGTGKTLLARALAASCRSNGKGISFFMRKGADVLSKWVGEAERQLRLLFEEARNSQPSIIFFDEIDGLAPVRSSKQDQIHASIVSTLLALMDGMDGRGQVVVIGATNRPDAVDPALRRPGRFDREFYFPLPTLDARNKILRIMTKEWAGWDGERGEEQRQP